VRDSNPLLRL